MQRVFQVCACFVLAGSVSGVSVFAQECGPDPGPPKAVSLAHCDVARLGSELADLFGVYAHASCRLAGAEKPMPEVSKAASRALALLSDPKVVAYAKACQKTDAESVPKEVGQ